MVIFIFFPFFTQNNDYDCGLVCLQMLYKYYFKANLDIDEVKNNNFLFANKGIKLCTLKKIAKNYHLNLNAYEIDKNKLNDLVITKPIIVQIINERMLYHFIIVYKRKKQDFLVADPAAENLK